MEIFCSVIRLGHSSTIISKQSRQSSQTILLLKASITLLSAQQPPETTKLGAARQPSLQSVSSPNSQPGPSHVLMLLHTLLLSQGMPFSSWSTARFTYPSRSSVKPLWVWCFPTSTLPGHHSCTCAVRMHASWNFYMCTYLFNYKTQPVTPV